MNAELLLIGFSLVANSLIVSGVALLLLLFLKKASAATRHQILLGLFIALAILPAETILMPPLHLGAIPNSEVEIIQAARRSTTPNVDNALLSIERDMAEREMAEVLQVLDGNTPGDMSTEPMTASAREQRSFDRVALLWKSLPWLLLAIWAFGVVVVLVIQLTRWAGVGFIAEMASGTEDSETDISTIAQTVLCEMGLNPDIQVLQSELAAVSMVWGFRKPCVILPREADDWSRDKIEVVLRHELAHVKRKDNLIHALALIISAMHWFNPFVWLALRRMHFHREVACDDAVLRLGTYPSTYAKHLMEIDMKLSGPKSSTIIPAVMAHSSNVKNRILSVLSDRANRRDLTGRMALSFTLIVLLLALPLSSVRLWSSQSMIQSAYAEWLEVADREGNEADLRFNGGNSYVTVPDSDDFDFTGDFTIETLINPATLSQNSRNLIVISKHRSHGHGGSWVMTILGPPNPVGLIQLTIWDNENSFTARTDPGAIQAGGEHCGGWVDIAFCYSEGSQTWRWFIDGQEVASGNHDINIGNTEHDLRIGWISNEPYHAFNGWMREVRISSTSRYAGSYNHEAPLNADGETIAFWDFSEGQGTTLHDVSGNGHDGTILNSTWEFCLSEVIEVEPGTNLQSVIDAAPDGAEIILLPGVHTGPAVIDGRNLTICGSGVENTTLDANFYDYAALVRGGGSLNLCDLRIINCFNDNPQEYYYPAALTVDDGLANVTHCLFENNLNACAAWRSNSLIRVTETTYITADAVGLITREADASTTIEMENCTIVGNRSDTNHGLIKVWGGNLVVRKCILSMESGRAIEWHSGSWTGDCNIVYAVDPGIVLPPNHWNVDPELCELNVWDYLVHAGSPALPGGNDCGVQIGSGGVCGVAVEDTNWSRFKSMY